MSKKQLFIFQLEPLESRYTAQWATHLPIVFNDALGDIFDIIPIVGDTTSEKPTDGAFLDFVATNCWKNEQASKFFMMLREGRVRDDAVILVTDFWNPTLNELKYTKELLGKSWTIISFAHAGYYDPQDFLGRLIKDTTWAKSAEISMYSASDKVVFATDWHVRLFMETYGNLVDRSKVLRVGFPMEYIKEQIHPGEKENLILFPHRLAPEKQVHIFDKLAEMLPEYKFVVCQREGMTKSEYHAALSRAKMVFSCSLQETLGISVCAEAAAAGAIPFAPDFLSYSEIFSEYQNFLYPARWILDSPEYERLAIMIKVAMTEYGRLSDDVSEYSKNTMDKYFSCKQLTDWIRLNT